jgi:hypothetical protein
VPQQLEDEGEKIASVMLAASGSILVAAPKRLHLPWCQYLILKRARTDSNRRPHGSKLEGTEDLEILMFGSH